MPEAMNEAVIHSLEGTNGNPNMYGAQSCLTHFSFMDACDSWSSAGSTLHEIFQARILEWIVISYSRRYSQPRDRTESLVSPALAGSLLHLLNWHILYHWATWESHIHVWCSLCEPIHILLGCKVGKSVVL